MYRNLRVMEQWLEEAHGTTSILDDCLGYDWKTESEKRDYVASIIEGKA